ncbi:DUF4112 domain-containing protein [Phenylobacterium sp.]|jgi:hypothetical protein|uniref:DUF4112 domain-containing protein n=1 Tax=Phenylobacterium sp. TaxID=1871053 RepID=UPI002E365C05|nr:DUF4112 domain-containing protein [Phenylobacterium sp.]HEX2558762.1 DUF4112 domain-containing protein [Phenylobacterium sp.]
MTDDKAKAHRAWRSAERIKRLSDRVVGIGPFGLGIDGVIAWVPGANAVYSLGAAGLLLAEAVNAGAKPATIAKMAAFLLADSATSAVPVLGWAVDTLFPGHALAAKSLQRDIEARHGPSDLEDNWLFRGRDRRGRSVSGGDIRGVRR